MHRLTLLVALCVCFATGEGFKCFHTSSWCEKEKYTSSPQLCGISLPTQDQFTFCAVLRKSDGSGGWLYRAEARQSAHLSEVDLCESFAADEPSVEIATCGAAKCNLINYAANIEPGGGNPGYRSCSALKGGSNEEGGSGDDDAAASGGGEKAAAATNDDSAPKEESGGGGGGGGDGDGQGAGEASEDKDPTTGGGSEPANGAPAAKDDGGPKSGGGGGGGGGGIIDTVLGVFG